MPGSLDWDDARETVVVVLLAAATMLLLEGVIRAIDGRDGQDLRSVLTIGLRPVDAVLAGLILASAVLVASAPQGSLPTGLRRIVSRFATAIAVLAVVSVLNGLTLPNAGSLSRLDYVFGQGMPAAVLAGGARWLVGSTGGPVARR